MSIAENFKLVSERLSNACSAAGRDSADVTLIAVSKTHPVDKIVEAHGAGARFFGENKVQEGTEKIPSLEIDAEWHLIGHLQKNKVRKAVQVFDVIQTVDSLKLANRIDRIANEEDRALKIMIQVDLAGEESKFGVPESELFRLAESTNELSRVELTGLMVIPPYCPNPEDVRPYFAKLRELRDEIVEEGFFADKSGHLSMGMSHDFEVAVQEGATHVRVGTAIFGERNYA